MKYVHILCGDGKWMALPVNYCYTNSITGIQWNGYGYVTDYPRWMMLALPYSFRID